MRNLCKVSVLFSGLYAMCRSKNYLAYLNRLFLPGWDKDWDHRVLRTPAPTTPTVRATHRQPRALRERTRGDMRERHVNARWKFCTSSVCIRQQTLYPSTTVTIL